MSMSFIASLANSAKGFKQGQDEEDDRQQKAKDRKRLEEDRAYQDEQRARQRKAQGEEDATADAVRAATAAVPQVQTLAPGDGVGPTGYQSGSGVYGDEATAQADRLRAQGIAAQGVYGSRGRVKEALDLGASVRQGEAGDLALSTARKQDKRGDEKYEQDKVEYAKKLAQEGTFDTVRAMQTGDVGAFMKAASTGEYRPVDGSVKVTPTTTTVAGKKVPSFDWEYTIQKPDGTTEVRKKNSLQAQAEMQPYEKIHAQGIAEQNADSRQLVAENGTLRAALAGGGRGGNGGGGQGGGQSSSISLEDRRKHQADFASYLADGKDAADPKALGAIQAGNAKLAAQADSIFETNAGLSIHLTAAQTKSAMQQAQDPKNIKLVRDNQTGTVYETVSVNGKSVVVGFGKQTEAPAQQAAPQPTAAPRPAAATASPPPAPSVATQGVVKTAPTNGQNIAASNPVAMQKIQPFIAARQDAKDKLAAVIKSGDQAAIQKYAQDMQRATTALETAAQQSFGGSANDILNNIYAK